MRLGGVGLPEMLIGLLIILLLFGGATRVPKLARGFGEAFKEFRKGKNEAEEGIEDLAEIKA
jgi:sec-independent protein translocase protein TatA